MTLQLASLPAQDEKPAAGKNVYRSDLSKRVDVGVWSNTSIVRSPEGGRPLLGKYGKGGDVGFVRLRLKDLPEHKFVRLRFNLAILGRADGTQEPWGPDCWSVMVDGGANLLLTSFANPRVFLEGEDGKVAQQSFPDEWPYAQHPAGTGAGEVIDLGFHSDKHPGKDTVYPFDMTFPHRGKTVTLMFRSRFSEPLADEAWGLERVVVDVLEAPEKKLADADLLKLWEALRGRDASLANKALWEIAAAGEGAVAAIAKLHEKAALGADGGAEKRKEMRAKFDKLIPSLEADEFAERVKAKLEISKLGPEVLPLIEKALEDGVDPETKIWLSALVKKFTAAAAATKEVPHTKLVASRVAHLHRLYAKSNDYTITSSHPRPDSYAAIGAPADGIVPAVSRLGWIPRYTWYPVRGGNVWLQYNFPAAKKISSAEVFWYLESTDWPGGARLPKSWEVQFQDAAGKWSPVETKDPYPNAPDKFNRIRFKEVETGAVRLSIEQDETGTAGAHEFRVLP